MSEEIKDMQEFAIEEKQAEPITDVLDPLDDLVKHDFTSDDEINLDASYEMISVIEREAKTAKALDAENVIGEMSGVYVNEEYKTKLDKSIDNVKGFIRKYNIELDDVKNLSDSEKTKLFAVGSFLAKNVSNMINDLKFTFSLERKEYKFIFHALERKMEYDGNEVFNIIELNERYLSEWKTLDKSLPKDVPSFIVDIDIKNLVMIYHFLGKYTVKGLGDEFYTFAKVLHKIADTNKLYNAYNVLNERLKTDFAVWTGAMDQEGPSDESVAGVIPPQ